MDPIKSLDDSKNFGDIFDLVKSAVKKILDMERAGLMLYVTELPINVGAYHQVGSNGIVLNRNVLNIVTKVAKSIREINSFVFTILLHEYLHSLGYMDEKLVEKVSYTVTEKYLGKDHIATEMLSKGLLRDYIPRIQDIELPPAEGPEIVTDFDRSFRSYIT
ncbi:MAG TPA: hypothetical protein VJ574_06520 [Candidatus Bathyarchaeia archaeon]|nr:hypothetical protein [Candidatus Bathyarchaeia archaeon]